jgi:alpha-beta hydrolase superfamily lysophospholipase
MELSHSEELVFATTEDGLQLEGVIMRPAGATAQAGHPVGVVWIHGNAASFCAPPYVAVGRGLAKLGHVTVIGNTRGHDIAATIWRAAGGTPVGGGAAWELLDEAPRDLAAWVTTAAAHAPGGIVLAGHSSGAQRVLLYQAERQDPRVIGVALVSPDLHGFLPPGELEAAQRLVAEGRDLEVTPAQAFAPWYRQSARTVVRKAAILARMLEAEDGEPTLAALRTPIWASVGAEEPRGADVLRALRDHARAPRVETVTIAGADHFYSARAADLATALAHWIGTIA